MPDFAIETEKLTRDFGEIRAVDGLTLQVPRGSVFGFLGPNGAGKTTTIRLLLGLLEPTDGRAKVLGLDIQKEADRIRASSGALLEHSGLYERLSAEDNIKFYGRIWHLSEEDLKVRIEEVLQHMGLWERRRESVGTWSRGMRQKLAVARALLHRPELVFMDEPTAGLDPVAAASLREDLALLAEQSGVTIFLTTHNLGEAEKLCDQVCVIREGKIVAIGQPDDLQRNSLAPNVVVIGRGFSEKILTELRRRPEVVSVEEEKDRLIIHLRGSGKSAPLINIIVKEGGEVEEVKKSKASLEEVFLLLMQEEEK
jgi:ABC-2 type transport system ATP-binding protein